MLAAEGVTVTETGLSSLGISPSDIANATTPAQKAALMQQAQQNVTNAGDVLNPDGTVTQSDFENLVTQFGGTKAQADQLFKSLDTGGDGLVSGDEFLNALGSTSQDGSSTVAQSLLKLMDTDGSGSVSSSEFIGFETAFAHAENGPA